MDRKFPTEINLSWQLTGDETFTQGNGLNYSVSIGWDKPWKFSVKQEKLEEVESHSHKVVPHTYLDFKNGEGTVSPLLEGGLHKIEERRELKDAQELAMNALRDSLRYPVLGHLREQTVTWGFYNANDMNIRAIKRQATEIDASQRTLAPDGCNLAMVIYNLTQSSNDGGIFYRLLGPTLRQFVQ